LVHGFGQKFEIFLLIILAKIGKENVLGDILYSKKGFLDNKNIHFKESKNCIFSKGLDHGRAKKFENFLIFYFRQNRQ